MLWTIFEILAYMIAAAVLGIILGWVLRGALGSEQAEVSSLRVQLRKLKRAQREAKKAQANAEKAAEAPKEIKAKVEDKPKSTPARTGSKPSKAERKVDQKNAEKAMVDIVGRVGKGESNDDLTKIYGIGPKFSSMLNKMDITSYAQIAKFTKDDIRVVSSALGSFSDRIERDDWVAGAKKVMKELKK